MNMTRSARMPQLNDLDKGMTMSNNKMTLRNTDVCIKRKEIALFLAVFMVLALTIAASSNVLAAGKVKAHGTLTSIEADGTVIIDNKGYLVSPHVTVLDYRGAIVSLSSLPPSSFVYFEYEYTTRGFVINIIKELAQ